ncbi:Transposon protein [Arachis hypogaea]|nr:Transposon protein [Arachis hypogaea]
MDYSTSDCQLNHSEVDFEFESNELLEPFCDVDEQFVPKIRMTFNTLEDAAKFYKDYSKAVVLHHSHPCCRNQAEMLKQHRELSMFVRRTIENNEEVGIRPGKTYQSFVAAAGGHLENRNGVGEEENYTKIYPGSAAKCSAAYIQSPSQQ